MSKKENLKKELAKLLEEKARREKYDQFHNYFFQDHKISDKGQDISRKNYPDHINFMKATKDYRELAFIAPNRSGKSEAGSYIIAALALKDYPEWWEGKKFDPLEPLKIMVLGKSNLAVRDVAQKKLVGSLFDMGSGMIPKENIVDYRKKMGTPDALQDLYVKDKYGCVNHIQFLSYEIDDDVVMGQELHVAWFDEECLKMKLYNEILMRTMTTGGFVFTTFTPLDGMTEGIQRYMPDLTFPEDGIVREDGEDVGRYVAHCGWDSAPHLTKEEKDDIRRRYHGAELIARTEGIPTIGTGQIYQVQESDVIVEPFEIPVWWPRAYGLDVGWNKTAAVWGALDPQTQQIYLYSEHYVGQEPPPVHASAIKARGDWMWGAVDPRADSRSQTDGTRLLDLYEQEGLNLTPADNSVDAGIYKIQNMLMSGQLKVFSTLKNWLTEFRLYRRDDRGRIVKKNDHAMDATRYLIMTGMEYAEALPDPDAVEFADRRKGDAVTGY